MQMFLIGWILLVGIAFFILAFFLEPLLMVGSYLIISFTMLLWGYIELRKEIERRKEEVLENTEDLLKKIPHTESTLSEDLLNSMLIDGKNKIFYMANREFRNEGFIFKSFPFSQLLEVALLEDGKVKYLYPKDGIIGGTVNEEGQAIINVIEPEELEYEDEDDDTIKKISLKLVVDDFSNPSIEYTFLENDGPIEKDSDDYKNAINQCTDWYKKISLAIKQYKYEKRIIDWK